MKLVLQNLTKKYKDANRELTILDNVSFQFPESGIVAIIGKSGIGKSTLLHVLGGLDTPDSGSLNYDDQDITKYTTEQINGFRSKTLGFIFQSHYLLKDFTAQENCALPLIVAGVEKGVALEESRQTLSLLGLGDRLTHFPGEMSGGEQQRVAIGRAIVHNPKVVLADEPTGSLDVETGNDIKNNLLSIGNDSKRLLIVVTHSTDFAKSADYVFEMKRGGGLATVKL